MHASRSSEPSPPAPAPGRVVLLPGWGTAPARLEPLAGDLAALGLDTEVLTYEPTGTIDELGGRLAEAVGRPGDEPSDLHLVGHSLGGLVSAAAALGPLAGRVASVTTVNAPWRGTWLGWTGDSPLAEALRWGREPLRRLRARLAGHLDAPSGPSWHLVGALGDLGVAVTSATLPVGPAARPRLERSVVPVAGHSVSLLAPRLRAAVSSWLPVGPLDSSGRPGG